MKSCKIVSRKFDIEQSHTLNIAREHGAYNAVESAFSLDGEAIIEIIKTSGLRGKGGGGAPAGKKLSLIPRDGKRPSYVVVIADESEPGTFKDRQIIAKDPHLLIEGMIITSYAIGAHDAYIYIRGEYYQFQKILQEAIDEAYAAGIIGEKVMEHDYRLDITVHRGAGAYICGEKSALLESMEGKRGVPFIVQNGADAYRQYGTKSSPGSLLFGLSGHVNRPGIYEVEFGVSMFEDIEHFGGGIKNGKKLKAVIPGGASTPVLTVEEAMCANLDYETLRAMGSSLGTGGMIVMDEDTCMVSALKNLLEFYHHESCGQCTPCREGKISTVFWMSAVR
jgi:NADH-quinone oxidoreductase subunit F